MKTFEYPEIEFRSGRVEERENALCLDLADLEQLINSHSRGKTEEICRQVSEWLACLGMRNSKVEWWCFNASTRNPLSSTLIYRILAYHVCKDIILNSGKNTILRIYNAPIGIRQAIQIRFFERKKRYWSKKALKGLIAITKITGLLLESCWHCYFRTTGAPRASNATGIFTYVDGGARVNGDPYFGALIHELRIQKPGLEVNYLAYVYKPFATHLKEIPASQLDDYNILFAYLQLGDYFYAWWKFTCFTFSLPKLVQVGDIHKDHPYHLILEDLMVDEISLGALYQYLIYLSFRRVALSGIYSRIIYPFENKALEKCLLLGIGVDPKIFTVGYQHSSITKRHFALQLIPDESEQIPMPDRIVTVGEVTSNWLTKTGGFPLHKVISGFSLRHAIVEKKSPEKAPRLPVQVLFALSSSRYELAVTVAFMKKLLKDNEQLELAMRCHPNFPASLLSREEQSWLAENVAVMDGTPLSENLAWAEIVCYSSSTVALEALASGTPIMRLKMEALNADPLLDDPSFRYECNSPESFMKVVMEIVSQDREIAEKLAKQGRDYVNEYLKPFNRNALMELFC